ncbi:MAG: FAD-dependent oxidoreductase [Alphaproteobacteria bacterium]|nr:FAD-dependent oxidoreductase [Alphaproteobacteria bacterium]MDX5369328.1 FAD-dependent oxidoreductase [Alphaproteobacteria bacterium]MDX5464013.1 FAD-dependent oxidoreductase [Alphaproteobacteria bacterium]
MTDHLIVGGGVAGLGLALRLLQKGVAVRVLERDRTGRAASWAAAGYLPPTVGTDPLARLHGDCVAAWPAFARELEALSGQSLDFHDAGALTVAVPETLAAARALYEAQAALGWPIAWLDGEEARALEPALGPDVVGAIHNPTVCWVDPRKVSSALDRAVRKLGGRIVEGTRVARVTVEAGRVAGVVLGDGTPIRAEAVTVAAGAWAGTLGGLDGANVPPMRPVRGQMAAVADDPASPLVRRLIRRIGRGAITPRGDGRLVIGTTVEDAGFAVETHEDDIARFMAEAVRILPALKDRPPIETWAGLRPYAQDGLPVLGPDGRVERLSWCAGYAADGIVCTSRVPALVADALTGGEAIDPAFRAGRAFTGRLHAPQFE